MESKLVRAARVFVPILAGLAVLAAAAWHLWPAQRAVTAAGVDLGRLRAGVARNAMNLVVVTLDTTRADRIGAYGRAGAAATPVFDRLAGEGVLFEQAMTSAPLTLPAHATMFTGAYPPQHGVRDNGGFFLDPAATTLAERLKAAGFRTGAFVGAYVLDSKWGLDQGFDDYVDDFDLAAQRGGSLGDISRRGAEVVDRALPWFERSPGQRFFAWLHFYDAHAPYDPPPPFAARFADQPYNGEVAYVDAQLGRVIGFLESRGLLESTIVAVLGDHGEGLGEHEEGTHGFFVYETVTHVPFLIRAPFDAVRGRRVAGPVRTADLAPTLLDLLGLPGIDTPVPGRSLTGVMTGLPDEANTDGYAEAMYPLHHYGWSAPRAVRSGSFKLIDTPRPELFDLAADPGETTNLFESRRDVANRLQRSLRALEAGFERAGKPPAAEAVDPETRARLASLGYVSSFVATAADDSGEVRADPKDKIALFNLMSEAQGLRDDPEAIERRIALLHRVVADDPKVIDAWFNLGNAHYRAGRPAEALEFFAKALALKPDYDLALINMANAYRALGKDDEALAGYDHYLRVDPKNAWVHYQAGEIHMDRGDLDRATAAFEAALSIDPRVAPARVALGAVAVARGDLSTADREIRAALATTPGVRLAHFNLGVLAEARGDPDTALSEYRLEYEQHDTAYRAIFNAARLLQQRRNPEALALFERAVSINARFAEGHFYLAQARLAAGDLAAATASARAGLALDTTSETAPLGHFVLAEVAMRERRLDDAARELAAGQALETRVSRGARR